jgi:hypothetical protein
VADAQDVDRGVRLVWVEVDRELDVEGTHDITGYRTFDLFVRSQAEAGVTLGASGSTGSVGELLFTDTSPWQHPFGSNVAPNPALVDLFSLLEYDSYFTVGGSWETPLSLMSPPDEDDWGLALDTLWFTTRHVDLEQDVERFGTDDWYTHLMRITVAPDTEVSGEMAVGLADHDQYGTFVAELLVPRLPAAGSGAGDGPGAGPGGGPPTGPGLPPGLPEPPGDPGVPGSVGLDLNGDTLIDAADLAYVFEANSRNDVSGDLTGDIVIDEHDVAYMLEALGYVTSDYDRKKHWKKAMKRLYKQEVRDELHDRKKRDRKQDRRLMNRVWKLRD